MMRIGLIDVDAESRGKVTFPNLSLMKISAWHKLRGDSVEWYNPLLSGHMDMVYMSKVFGDEYTKDYPYFVDAMAMDGLDRANRRTVTVDILTNFNSTHEQDIHRIMQVREAGAQPYVMIYRKPTAPKITRQLARWVNAPNIFWSVPTFEKYRNTARKEK